MKLDVFASVHLVWEISFNLIMASHLMYDLAKIEEQLPLPPRIYTHVDL